MRVLTVLSLSLLVIACKREAAPVEAPAPTPAPAVAPAAAPGEARTIELKVTEDGFEPANLTVKKDQPLKLVVTRLTDATCATDLLIEGTEIAAKLPLNTPTEIAWTPTAAGKVKFGCAMDKMVGGVLLVE